MERLYDRTSRRCDAGGIEAGLRSAIAEHAEAHQLGDVLADAAACCETRSVRLYKPTWWSRRRGSADPDTEHRTAALVTPRSFIVAVTGEQRGTTVMSARLDGLSVTEGGVAARLSPELRARLSVPVDFGLSVTALWSGGGHGTGVEASSYFVGLGDDPDGRAFAEAVRAAVVAAKTR